MFNKHIGFVVQHFGIPRVNNWILYVHYFCHFIILLTWFFNRNLKPNSVQSNLSRNWFIPSRSLFPLIQDRMALFIMVIQTILWGLLLTTFVDSIFHGSYISLFLPLFIEYIFQKITEKELMEETFLKNHIWLTVGLHIEHLNERHDSSKLKWYYIYCILLS